MIRHGGIRGEPAAITGGMSHHAVTASSQSRLIEIHEIDALGSRGVDAIGDHGLRTEAAVSEGEVPEIPVRPLVRVAAGAAGGW